MPDDKQKPKEEQSQQNKPKTPRIKTFSVTQKEPKEPEISEDLFSIRKNHEDNDLQKKDS